MAFYFAPLKQFKVLANVKKLNIGGNVLRGSELQTLNIPRYTYEENIAGEVGFEKLPWLIYQ